MNKKVEAPNGNAAGRDLSVTNIHYLTGEPGPRINGKQQKVLRDLVLDICELSRRCGEMLETWQVWDSLNNYCDVPHHPSDGPRYQMMPASRYERAECYLLRQKVKTLEGVIKIETAKE